MIEIDAGRGSRRPVQSEPEATKPNGDTCEDNPRIPTSEAQDRDGDLREQTRTLPTSDPADSSFETAMADAMLCKPDLPQQYWLRVYDPDALRRAIEGITGARESGDDYYGLQDEGTPSVDPDLVTEDKQRLKRLRALAADDHGSLRPLIRCSPVMVERLEAVKVQASHFAPAVDLVIRAVQLAVATDAPLRLPPVLLLGDPGIGKTWAMKQISVAIGSAFSVVPLNITDSFRLRGLNSSWKGAKPGKIAENLLASGMASPLILLDEFDKIQAIGQNEKLFDIMHTLLERENAVDFVDDYYEISFRCDRIIWFATANTLEGLPDSIVDRLLVIHIKRPDGSQLLSLIDGLYRTKRDDLGGRVADELVPEVRAALARHTPRRAGRLIEIGFGFMAADGRTILDVMDIEQAARILNDPRSSGTFRHPVGFRR